MFYNRKSEWHKSKKAARSDHFINSSTTNYVRITNYEDFVHQLYHLFGSFDHRNYLCASYFMCCVRNPIICPPTGTGHVENNTTVMVFIVFGRPEINRLPVTSTEIRRSIVDLNGSKGTTEREREKKIITRIKSDYTGTHISHSRTRP